MYINYWKLQEPPFENVIDSKYVYYSANHDEALMRLVYTVRHRKGACLITGDVGCGKTTISRVFQESLEPEKYEVSLVSNPNLSAEELLQEILHQFGCKYDNMPKIELLHALEKKMRDNFNNGKESVVIIDEAHLIRGKEAYEELRLLLNLQQDKGFLVTLILIGQPELRYMIRSIPQFEQRIPVQFHLLPLDFVNTCKYIHCRMTRAGNAHKIFTANTAKKIYTFSEGIPRKINNVCDMSLLAGFIDQANYVDSTIIDKIIADQVQ